VTLNGGWAYRSQIDARGRGRAVLAYLVAQYAHSDEAGWREHIALGEVSLQGRRANGLELLCLGDVLIWNRPPWTEEVVPLSFALLYEDEDLIAVGKPSGLATLPGGGFLDNTLLARVRARWPEASPMHRLGRGTSGLVLFARTELARARLQLAWRGREVRKVYRALASGRPLLETFTVRARIGPVQHALLGQIFAASPSGKVAISHVAVLERRADESLVEVAIETGRPHQIRIHLAAAGHPLAGDPLYIAPGIPAPGTRALPGDAGYLLHASLLAFAHPRSGEAVVLRCAPPPGLEVNANHPALRDSSPGPRPA